LDALRFIRTQQISFAVISTGGSSWFISGTLENPTGTYPSPVSASPPPFTIFTGSSNALQQRHASDRFADRWLSV
jgi:hypothetical protein